MERGDNMLTDNVKAILRDRLERFEGAVAATANQISGVEIELEQLREQLARETQIRNELRDCLAE